MHKKKCFYSTHIAILSLVRLQPLGRVSDPSMVSNSCLGIVSGELVHHLHCHSLFTAHLSV